jgi:hypothetical protein
VILLVALACADADPVAAPTLTFLSPRDGDTLPVGTHTVSVLVENFALVAPKHNEGVPVGFLVVRQDGADAFLTGDTTFDIALTTPGAVTLSAALEYADGDPLDPPVGASVTLTVTP